MTLRLQLHFLLALGVLTALLALSGCGGAAATPATAVQLPATWTPTPIPPSPTVTPVPPTATPAPPTATPLPPTDTPAPTNTPEPAPTEPPAPTPTPRPRVAATNPPPTNTPAPAAADPCATIGGDGCKFKLRGGPAFTANGGSELKLTLAFVHSGRNDEAQGSYFVWLEKDGAKLPVPDSVRSWTGEKRPGPHGAYNYEYKLGLAELPGNNVAGGYRVWVLDGNGERDSQTFAFVVPDGQGEVWIKFDQS